MKLTYLQHSGFLVETAQCSVVFDLFHDACATQASELASLSDMSTERTHAIQADVMATLEKLESSKAECWDGLVNASAVTIQADTINEAAALARAQYAVKGDQEAQALTAAQSVAGVGEYELERLTLEQLQQVYCDLGVKVQPQLFAALFKDLKLQVQGYAANTGEVARTLLESVLLSKRCYFLVSHFHQDHFTLLLLRLYVAVKECCVRLGKANCVKLIFSRDVYKYRRHWIKEFKDEIVWLRPEESFDDETLHVEAWGSTDVGVSFAVRLEGINLFHAGDLNNWQIITESIQPAAAAKSQEAIAPVKDYVGKESASKEAAREAQIGQSAQLEQNDATSSQAKDQDQLNLAKSLMHTQTLASNTAADAASEASSDATAVETLAAAAVSSQKGMQSVAPSKYEVTVQVVQRPSNKQKLVQLLQAWKQPQAVSEDTLQFTFEPTFLKILHQIQMQHDTFDVAMFPCDFRGKPGFLRGMLQFIACFAPNILVTMHMWNQQDLIWPYLQNLQHAKLDPCELKLDHMEKVHQCRLHSMRFTDLELQDASKFGEKIKLKSHGALEQPWLAAKSTLGASIPSSDPKALTNSELSLDSQSHDLSHSEPVMICMPEHDGEKLRLK